MLVKLEKITKTYGQKEHVLDGTDFVINSGDWVSVVGPSGCGKSTLLNIIGCLLRPTSGRLIIDGQDTSSLSDRQLTDIRNSKIGFIFQGSYLIPTLNLQENVLAPVMFSHSLKRAERTRKVLRARELLEELGLGDRLNSLPHHLSLGQRRRVAIARALINDPIVVLADEPTNDLDPVRAQQISDIFKELNNRGMTILMVTHRYELAQSARTKFQLNNGRLHPLADDVTGFTDCAASQALDFTN